MTRPDIRKNKSILDEDQLTLLSLSLDKKKKKWE